ncbi:MAG: HvfX family Cu-binding RiPP maturation protein [Panacagrimonas sp.]
MAQLNKLYDLYADAVRIVSKADFLAPLLLRLYLAPVFWMAGWNKLAHFEDTSEWFGNAEWGLGLPFPDLMAAMATGSELGGAALLLAGLGVRLIAVPLMVTMLVAIFAVHWPHGWPAIAESMGFFATDMTIAAVERLGEVKELLRQHGDYDYLTEHGSLVMLNNGIEFAATYFVMLLALLFTGAGRWLSVDWWIARRFSCRRSASRPATAAY